jgi:hypothetical protein
MAIGIYELLILLFLFIGPAILVAVIAVVVWLRRRSTRASTPQAVQRRVADRLAELESLRQAGHISTDEYEKQRAAIISCV